MRKGNELEYSAGFTLLRAVSRRSTYTKNVRQRAAAHSSDRTTGFISVGATCQRSNHLTSSKTPFSRPSLSSSVRLRPGQIGGIPVLCPRTLATGRMNSSLRGHRPWRSQCRHACSGPNKTLFAPVGPNSRWRGHRRAGRWAWPKLYAPTNVTAWRAE